MVYCELSGRQRALYRVIRDRLSLEVRALELLRGIKLPVLARILMFFHQIL